MSAIMALEKGDLDVPEKREKYTVCVIGCGRMGLPTACLFAEARFKVLCADANPQVVNSVNEGKAPFSEPGMGTLIKKHVKGGRLKAINDNREAASLSDIILLVLPTFVDEKRKPDYGHFEKVCKEVGMGLRSGSLIIVESTTGPGITEILVKESLENASGLRAGVNFGLAHSPIRATSGHVLRDIETYPKVVGATNERSLDVACLVLGTVTKGGMVGVRDIKTAEAVKLFENVQRDVDLALANEFALLCEKIGIDFIETAKAANTQPYCHLLFPGLVSGHIPKDPYLLIDEAENVDARLRMATLARKINDEMLRHTLRLTEDALRHCGKTLRRAKIPVLGVSYRPNVKNPQGTSTRELVNMLSSRGAKVLVYDPFFSYKELMDMGYPTERTLTKIVEGADCLIIAVGHDKFHKLNLKRIKFLFKSPAAIVDIGHVIDPTKAMKEGFVYRGVGRGVGSI
jgi:UDP-N-acetyl-D-mannosaminuronic acid dehydrogenase